MINTVFFVQIAIHKYSFMNLRSKVSALNKNVIGMFLSLLLRIQFYIYRKLFVLRSEAY